MASKLSAIQLEKTPNSLALKLPHLFSLTPTSGKGAQAQKRQPVAPQTIQAEEDFPEGKSLVQPVSTDHVDNPVPGLHSFILLLFVYLCVFFLSMS